MGSFRLRLRHFTVSQCAFLFSFFVTHDMCQGQMHILWLQLCPHSRPAGAGPANIQSRRWWR